MEALPEAPSSLEGLALVCEFVITEARKLSPRCWRQAARRPALVSFCTSDAVRLLTSFHVRGMPEAAARGVARWNDGLPVRVVRRVPAPRELLELQASGARCVSLLAESDAESQKSSALGFLLHDLCHIGKFSDPEHYCEQVGFFATFSRAAAHDRWRELEGMLDAEWLRDEDHVFSDMNGSSIFLFAAFKMKLKMAARRLSAARAGGSAPCQGRLGAHEQRLYEELFERVLGLLEFPPELRAAARVTSARRDCPRAAGMLAEYFRARGTERLATPKEGVEGGQSFPPFPLS